MSKLSKMVFLVTVFSCGSMVAADENRAVVKHISAVLELPDKSALNVDMSLDCGSRYQRTALIVTSRQGAEILATAWSALYGPAAGAAVIKQWETKTEPSDPRLPTFMIVTPPVGKTYIANSSGLSSKSAVSTKSSSLETADTQPEIMTTCGHRDHVQF